MAARTMNRAGATQGEAREVEVVDMVHVNRDLFVMDKAKEMAGIAVNTVTAKAAPADVLAYRNWLYDGAH